MVTIRRALGERSACDLHEQILSEERHSVKGSLRVRLRQLLAGPSVELAYHGIEPRVERLDPLDRGVEYFRCNAARFDI
jgi:hypothetical protein